MENFPTLAEAYIKLAKFMTWGRFFKTVAALVLCITMYTLFENRQTIYDGIIASTGSQRTMIHAPITELTKRSIQDLLDKPSNIIAVQFVSVDFKTNTRNTEYFRSNSVVFQKAMDDYANTKLAPTPFFTDDIRNNERNTHLMNGDFVCNKVSDIKVFQKFGDISRFADTVCSVSIPPYPGYFSGYITFYVKGSPDAFEQAEIRAAARKLSIATYDADVAK